MTTIDAHIAGTVWTVDVGIGDQVDVGDTVAVIESMKMEMPVEAEAVGVVSEVLCTQGESVQEGQPLVRLAS